MTDPGGGHGWRGARHLPRRRGGVLALARVAERADPRHRRSLCVLLLPQELEQMPDPERVYDLLDAPGVVAVDPARISYAALGRLPEAVLAGIAAGQARRLRLPGLPRAIVLFGALQYPLARALLSEHPDAQLWVAEPPEGPAAGTPARMAQRITDLAGMAAMRADVRFGWPGDGADPAHERNGRLWERMEALGVESGRLGSERPDVRRAAGG